MKLPKSFRPKKDLDDKTKQLVEEAKIAGRDDLDSKLDILDLYLDILKDRSLDLESYYGVPSHRWDKKDIQDLIEKARKDDKGKDEWNTYTFYVTDGE